MSVFADSEKKNKLEQKIKDIEKKLEEYEKRICILEGNPLPITEKTQEDENCCIS